jgi:hypothetical protein
MALTQSGRGGKAATAIRIVARKDAKAAKGKIVISNPSAILRAWRDINLFSAT